MNLDLTNKTALVCGASQGLGLACAAELALMGANVIAASRNENKLQSAIKNLDTSKGQQHSFLVLDLSNPDEVKQTVSAFLSKGNTIHILINNAGGPPSAPMIETDAAEIEKAFNRFEKLETEEPESFGLGLAIVKSIAAFHNIDISIKSDKGRGTTFLLTFNR